MFLLNLYISELTLQEEDKFLKISDTMLNVILITFLSVQQKAQQVTLVFLQTAKQRISEIPAAL